MVHQTNVASNLITIKNNFNYLIYGKLFAFYYINM